LSEVLEVKIAPGIEEDHTELSRSPTHFFEIRTHTSTYFIGKSIFLVKRNFWKN